VNRYRQPMPKRLLIGFGPAFDNSHNISHIRTFTFHFARFQIIPVEAVTRAIFTVRSMHVENWSLVQSIEMPDSQREAGTAVMTEDKCAGGKVVEVDPVLNYFQARVVQEMITGGPLCSTRFAL